MIAISYRREDSLPIAGRLYDRLQSEFGKGNVFMDFDSIPYGVDFREHIKHMIDRSKVLVAIIGSDWFGKRRQRPRRIDDPTDFVRLEIAYALQRGIPVIPVLIDNMPMPKATDLPADIEALAFRNAVSLDIGIDFHHHVDRLVVGIDRLVNEVRKSIPLAKDKIPDFRRKPEMPLTSGFFQDQEPPPKQTERPPPFLQKIPAPEKPQPPRLPTPPPIIQTPKPSEATNETTNRRAPPYEMWLRRLQIGITRVRASIADLQLPKRKFVLGAIGLLAIIFAIAIFYRDPHHTVAPRTEQQNLPQPLAPFSEQELTKIKPEESSSAIPASPPSSSFTSTPTPETLIGTLQIDSMPPGETFELIDAANVHRTGTTPATFTDVSIGDSEIIYKKDGVQEHRETVFISADKTASVTWTFPEQSTVAASTSPNFVADTANKPAPTISSSGTYQRTRDGKTYVWNNYPKPTDQASWLGERDPEGYATGNGSLNWYKHGRWISRYTGSMVRGKLNGFVINEDANGAKFQGAFVDGTKSSDWAQVREFSTPTPILTQTSSPSEGPSPTPAVDQSNTSKLLRFINKKYGFSALIPTAIFANAPETSDLERNLFFSTDKQTILHLFVEHSARPLKEIYQQWAAEHTPSQPRKIVHYKVFRDNWFVASGTDGERGFYIKGVKKGDGIVIFMYLQYNENTAPFSKDTFNAMSRGFDGN
jgi:hypothetical protein